MVDAFVAWAVVVVGGAVLVEVVAVGVLFAGPIAAVVEFVSAAVVEAAAVSFFFCFLFGGFVDEVGASPFTDAVSRSTALRFLLTFLVLFVVAEASTVADAFLLFLLVLPGSSRFSVVGAGFDVAFSALSLSAFAPSPASASLLAFSCASFFLRFCSCLARRHGLLCCGWRSFGICFLQCLHNIVSSEVEVGEPGGLDVESVFWEAETVRDSDWSTGLEDCFLSFTVPLLPGFGVESDWLPAGTEQVCQWLLIMADGLMNWETCPYGLDSRRP